MSKVNSDRTNQNSDYCNRISAWLMFDYLYGESTKILILILCGLLRNFFITKHINIMFPVSFYLKYYQCFKNRTVFQALISSSVILDPPLLVTFLKFNIFKVHLNSLLSVSNSLKLYFTIIRWLFWNLNFRISWLKLNSASLKTFKNKIFKFLC